ncbi:MAG: efflux RND transporter permease subunit [Bacteroidaceae bacterium]|nr:efflux RND transporter permease subunit [Bacteroidaceae bacterium]MBR1669025.1 efflux RND transporter permease subunit [Bacteroidaceae bacterium]
MNISKWALENSKLINFLVVVLVVGGLLSYGSMSKLEDPAIKVKQAIVVTTYPGASAHQVELEVTDPLEKSIREMSSIDNIQSQSYADLSLITVELLTTVPDENVEQQWDMLRRKVANVQSKLPSGASASQVKDDFGDVYGMFYALKGDGQSDKELNDYAELIKRAVSEIDGVSRVEIYGKRNECINIELCEDKMANLGVMPTEVIQTLNNQNKTSYAGYYDNGDRRVRVTVDDKFNNVDDIANMLIQGHDDDQLRIKDIATVVKTYEATTRNLMTCDSVQALGISIACSSDYDILKVGAKVEKTVANIEQRFPAGIECQKVFFQPERVSNALNTFLINLVESVAIVVLLLVFFMGWKSGYIIGCSLVVIVFGSFLVLKGFDGTLQRVSLASFILAMGMLVDNAIVIVDGILVDMKQGKPRREALTSIGQKTAMPLLGATLIAILAFLPIFMSPDTAGVYVRDLFIVIAVSLLLSWILALVHVPVMSNRMFKNVKVSSEKKEEALYQGKAYDVLEVVLRFGLKHRFFVVIGAVVLLGISAFCYQFVNQAFFPDMEYDQLYMEYKLPEGYNSTQTTKDLEEIRKRLMKHDYITHVTTSIGGTPSRYNLVRSIATPSLSYGELIIDFTSPSDLVEHMDSIQKEINDLYPDAYVKFKRYNLMFKKYPIEACFHGPDPAVLHRLTDSARAIVNASDKVYLATSDWEPQVPVLSIDYDQASARNSGLSRSDVALSMMAYTGGVPIGTFYDGINPQNIYVKCTDEDGNNVENLENARVFGVIPNVGQFLNRSTVQKLMTGTVTREQIIENLIQTTPLKQVSHGIDIKWEEPVVVRYDGQRTQRLQCSPAPGVGTEAARKAIAEKIEQIELPEGYSLTWEGEKKASDQSMKYLFDGFPICIVIMILILVMLFKDYKKPTIIFCCIPLVITGVIPVVLMTGKPFGFVAIVGVLGLIGMMIKNGIVLMDEINLEINQGLEPRVALIQSSKSRLRPVMMASLTTILGMIPLVPDSMFGSLAVTIMGGLFMGTLITLIFIPVLYAMFFKVK